jgi:L-alanine-DL-glutamate epimerase-like enolase superfamily enzyme
MPNGGGTTMRVATVEGFHLVIPGRYQGPAPRGMAQWSSVEMLLVRVETESGIVGWGESFAYLGAATTRAALETLVAPLCIGADGRDIDGLCERVRRSLHAYGWSGPVLFAWSGVEIALWDIRGKVAGLPVHRLLGNEAERSSVPAYASLLRYGDADSVGNAVLDAAARGFGRVKLHEASVAAVAAARDAGGSGLGLMLDVNGRWTPDEAVARAFELEPYELEWLEEPSWPLDAARMKRIAAETGVALAAGENARSVTALARLADAGVVVLQPSAAKQGGLTALIGAAALAKQRGLRAAPHSAYFGPALAATIQFCAAFAASCEWYCYELEANPCDIAPQRGELAIPPGPGLGIEVDTAVVARFRRA